MSATPEILRNRLLFAAANQARLAMANGALLAGISFSNSLVGVVHSLAHACGGVAHVPHGVANAILLPIGVERIIVGQTPVAPATGGGTVLPGPRR